MGAEHQRRVARKRVDSACVRPRGALALSRPCVAAGLALGLSVSTKFVLWPMFVWMLVTRRLRASTAAIAIGIAVTLAAWAVIGFDGLTGYPDLAPATLRHPGREQLLAGRHGRYSSGCRTRLVGRSRSSSAAGYSPPASSSPAEETRPVPSRVRSPPRSRCRRSCGSTTSWCCSCRSRSRARGSLRSGCSRPALGQPEARVRRGIQTFVPAVAVAILLGVLLARPRVPRRASGRR